MPIVLPFEEAKQYILQQMEAYLQQSRGINTKRKFQCLNPDHQDNDPSMGFWRAKNIVHCFSCNKSYDIFGVIGIDYNLTTFKEKWAKACEIFDVEVEHDSSIHNNLHKPRPSIPQIATNKNNSIIKPRPKQNYVKYYERLNAASSSTDYMRKRGISNEISDKFKVLYDPNFRTRDNAKGSEALLLWKAVVIPKTATAYLVRNTDEKCKKFNRIRNRGNAALYNRQILGKKIDHPIFIVEGEFDVLSIYEVGGEAIGISGTSGINRLIEAVKACKQELTLLVALDNDPAGESASMELLLKLKQYGISCNKVNIYGRFKDANEALVNDRVTLKNNIYAELHKDIPKNPKFVFRIFR